MSSDVDVRAMSVPEKDLERNDEANWKDYTSKLNYGKEKNNMEGYYCYNTTEA